METKFLISKVYSIIRTQPKACSCLAHFLHKQHKLRLSLMQIRYLIQLKEYFNCQIVLWTTFPKILFSLMGLDSKLNIQTFHSSFMRIRNTWYQNSDALFHHYWHISNTVTKKQKKTTKQKKNNRILVPVITLNIR